MTAAAALSKVVHVKITTSDHYLKILMCETFEMVIVIPKVGFAADYLLLLLDNYGKSSTSS